MVSSVKLERSHFFARHDSESKEHSFESSQRDNYPKVDRLLRRRWQLIAEGADTRRRSRNYVRQRIERKAPWEPRSFTEDNAFHHKLRTRQRSGARSRWRITLGFGVGRGVAVGVALAVAVAVAVAVGSSGRSCGSVAVAVAVAVVWMWP